MGILHDTFLQFLKQLSISNTLFSGLSDRNWIGFGFSALSCLCVCSSLFPFLYCFLLLSVCLCVSPLLFSTAKSRIQSKQDRQFVIPRAKFIIASDYFACVRLFVCLFPLLTPPLSPPSVLWLKHARKSFITLVVASETLCLFWWSFLVLYLLGGGWESRGGAGGRFTTTNRAGVADAGLVPMHPSESKCQRSEIR